METLKIRAMARPFCAALLMVAACGSDASTGPSSDVASLEAELAAATQSQSSAASVASACFDTFKSCASAAGSDLATCKSELEACLPDAPPAPSCGDTGGHDSDAGAHALSAYEADAGAHALRSHDADAGAPHVREHGGEGMHGRGMHGDRGCRAPQLKPGALGACRDAAAQSATRTDPSAARSGHARCLESAFADKIRELCKKAESLCAEPSAPAELCSRVTSACSAVGDAGQ